MLDILKKVIVGEEQGECHISIDPETEDTVSRRGVDVLDENKEDNENYYFSSIEDIVSFADNYGITLDYLFGRTETPYYTL